MNHRQRFSATMRYQSRDRIPMFDFGYWDETINAWHAQGLPAEVKKENIFKYFGLDFNLSIPSKDFPGVTFATGTEMGLVPRFEEIIIEDREDEQIIQQSDGVRVLRKKHHDTIPLHIGHLLEDRDSWQKHYKPRLDPAHPERMPVDLAECVAAWQDPQHGELIIPWVGGLYGWLRDWMGVEKLSYVMYDDRPWFEEMVATVADCIYGTLERLLSVGARVDACAFWEDMCYNAGPLISPRVFKQVLVPHYRRITDLLHRHGVDIVWVDCDGKIDLLIPLWMEAGINCMFPLEIGTWNADPLAYRQTYGRDLLLMGGFDKRILAGTPDDILREIDRLAPLVEEGGYIPFCDHLVPPGVSLANYIYYLECAREIWCNDVNLNPMGAVQAKP
ncbi:MAG: uroporphyrinogen decarboxylase family protein [Anaerolineales bacterium]